MCICVYVYMYTRIYSYYIHELYTHTSHDSSMRDKNTNYWNKSQQKTPQALKYVQGPKSSSLALVIGTEGLGLSPIGMLCDPHRQRALQV